MLTKPPIIIVETINQKEIAPGFLSIDRRRLKFTYPDSSTAEMEVDSVVRDRADAVVIAAHYTLNAVRYVYLRSSLRPALSLRNYLIDGRPENVWTGCNWELPAGLVEKNECGEIGLLEASARELYEEVGLKINPGCFKALGFRTFPSVGMVAERLYFFEAEVNPEQIEKPTEDGSALEKGGQVIVVPLKLAVQEVEKGCLIDAKTEIGLYRLARKYCNENGKI